jgi:hypothetical protein
VTDLAHARQHDADAEALELGLSKGIASLFEVIDLEPIEAAPCPPFLRLVASDDPGIEATVKETLNV